MKSIKQKLALVATTATVAATAAAGKLADSITGNQAVTDATADLYTVGGVVIGLVVVGVVIGLVVVGVVFGAGIKLFRKGG